MEKYKGPKGEACFAGIEQEIKPQLYKGKTVYYDNSVIEGYLIKSKGKDYILTKEGADCIETHYFGQENEIHIAEVEEVERI